MPDGGRRVAEELGERGWTVSRTLVMEYDGSLEREPRGRAEAVDARAVRGARLEALPDRDPDLRRQIADYTERLVAVNDGRVFAAFGDGEVAAFCSLFECDGVAELDEVTTLERFRRRGLGAAAVETALATALAGRNELVFILADARDWPRHWYARLGFRPIGTRYEVHRAVPLP
jgi:GNAT superfamily N-acetyltransferase